MRSYRAQVVCALCFVLTAPLAAVTVETWQEEEPKEFEKGKCEGTVISSLGRVLLGRDQTEILKPTGDVEFVNALAQGPDGTAYAATGPNGIVYRIKDDRAEVLATIKSESNLFSLLIAPDGGLFVGTGGQVGRIYKVSTSGQAGLWFDPERVELTLPDEKTKPAAETATKPTTTAATTGPAKTPTTTRQASKVNYIWAMARGSSGQVYAATGAQGFLLEISQDGKQARVVFDSKETNLLSLAIGRADTLYTGSDKNGLIYRVDPKKGRAFVLYDAGEAEVSAVALDGGGNVYAATAAASAARPGKEAKPKPSGRPGSGPTTSGAKGKAAGKPQTRRSVGQPVPSEAPPSGAPGQAKEAGNAVYRIAPDGMVTEVFREPVMILDMIEADGRLYLATGNEGRVYQVHPDKEEQISLAKLEDKQVTAILKAKDGRLLLGASNQGRIVSLSSHHTAKGIFVSQVLDAKQISRWGRVHWEGDLPNGTAVTVSTRSGNVADPEEGTWDDWSGEIDAHQGAQIPSPSARFLQYRLTLKAKDPKHTPLVRLVALARQSANMPPKVAAVEIGPVLRAHRQEAGAPEEQSEGPTPPLPPGTTPSTRIIKWKADDPNRDRLLYDIYFRQLGHERWILLKEDNKTPEYKWNTRGVADGQYEIRIVAKDAPSNPPTTALTDDRISDVFVVDNSPPKITGIKTEKLGKERFRVNAALVDEHSPVTAAHYTVDSNEKWVAVLAEDDLFDSKQETISFELTDLEPGQHVVTIRAQDDEHNKGYATVVVDVKEE